MVENKDVVLAVLGASSAFAGFVLVFLGVVLSTLQSYGAETPRSVTRGYRIIATEAAVAFLFGVASVAMCVLWLAGDQTKGLRWAALGSLAAQLVLLVLAAAWVLIKFVWKDA